MLGPVGYLASTFQSTALSLPAGPRALDSSEVLVELASTLTKVTEAVMINSPRQLVHTQKHRHVALRNWSILVYTLKHRHVALRR